jgi:hypothetical protein
VAKSVNHKTFSATLHKYEKNREKPPFQIGQKVKYISPNSDQTVRTIVWSSAGATCRGDQLVSVDEDGDRITASVFVDSVP